ncbi:MAG TPA: hypothetical protein VI365_21730 [Trebonia sp.]
MAVAFDREGRQCQAHSAAANEHGNRQGRALLTETPGRTKRWTPLLSRARTRKIARPLGTLVLARHARYLGHLLPRMLQWLQRVG